MSVETLEGDGAWLAFDAEGHVAVLTTAGAAPVPRAILAALESWSPEPAIQRLPELGAAELLVRDPGQVDYGDWVAWAERGLYAYDWPDVHRVSGLSGCYELIARPRVPLLLDGLPEELARVARLVRSALPFAGTTDLALAHLGITSRCSGPAASGTIRWRVGAVAGR